MAQVQINLGELEAFVGALNTFNGKLDGDWRQLKARWQGLQETWRDPECAKFLNAGGWQHVISQMDHYLQSTEQYVQHLKQKAEPLKRYRQVSVPGASGVAVAAGSAAVGVAAASSHSPNATDPIADPNLTAAAEVAARGHGVSSIWDLDQKMRGAIIDQVLGHSPCLVWSFPHIDRFENGIATSIKSIDPRDTTYQRHNKFEERLRDYIDDMVRYRGQPHAYGGVRILPREIKGRNVDLAIPASGLDVTQMNILRIVQQYASGVGVNLRVIIIP